jgi:hypothetical protein
MIDSRLHLHRRLPLIHRHHHLQLLKNQRKMEQVE